MCGSQDSVFYIKPDGLEGEVKLCRSCAATRFSSMIDDKEGIASDRECPVCSWSAERLKSTGRLGCPECARSFRRDVDAILRRAGRVSTYEGRVPDRMTRPGADGEPDPARLSESLDAAILAEDFESAASIRDVLKDVSVRRNN
jgi:protein arginine kinase activator